MNPLRIESCAADRSLGGGGAAVPAEEKKRKEKQKNTYVELNEESSATPEDAVTLVPRLLQPQWD